MMTALSSRCSIVDGQSQVLFGHVVLLKVKNLWCSKQQYQKLNKLNLPRLEPLAKVNVNFLNMADL